MITTFEVVFVGVVIVLVLAYSTIVGIALVQIIQTVWKYGRKK